MKKTMTIVLCICLMMSLYIPASANDTVQIGSFAVNATTPMSLGTVFTGKVFYEYDLHIPANITSANNAVVFGGDGLTAWAGVGAALYINSSWSGVEDVFYTQNATGNGTGNVQGSALSWKNMPESGIVDGYTTYHVEQIIDTSAAIADGYGIYQIYITPEGGERTLITTSSAPGSSEQGWHGFRTSYSEITKIGVWTNYGVNISVTNLRATVMDGTAEKIIVPGVSVMDGYGVVRSVACAQNGVDAYFNIESDNKDSVKAIIAIYDEDENLLHVSTQNIALTGSDSVKVSCPPEFIAGAASVRVVLWENGSLRPITDTFERDIATKGDGFVSLSSVALLDGMFETSRSVGIEYIKSMDVDRLLAPLFEVQSLPTPNGAVRYGGWEGLAVHGWGGNNFTLAGHSLGHWLSAAAVSYAATADTELKQMLDYAVSQLDYIQTTQKTGYIGGINESCFQSLFSGNTSSWSSGYWVPWYNVHKTYQGLIDAYTYAQNKDALRVVIKFAQWAYDGTKSLSDSQMQTMLGVEHGGMNDAFAQLYDITGDESYLYLAKRFTHNAVVEPLVAGTDSLTGLHANTQIPKIIGAAQIYDEDSTRTDLRDAAKFFWDSVVNTRSYVIGGNSIGEHFEALGAETLGIKTCESCNTYNMLKLTEHLFSWEHDSRYMDFYETALYNHILGHQDPDTGNKMYFVSTLPGHYRIYGTAHDSFWCCTGTGMENPGRYSKCIYYKENNDLYVNLFISSEITWEEKNLKIKMETDFPYSSDVLLTVTEGEADANIKIRVPAWVAGEVSARVNGGEAVSQGEGGYLTIEGNWKAGDTIALHLPMQLEKYTARDKSSKVAFTYGPVVLAATLGTDGFPQTDTYVNETNLDSTTTDAPNLIYDGTNLNEIVKLKDANTLCFTIDGEYSSLGEEITLLPFHDVHHQFYCVYFYLNDEGDVAEKKLNKITLDSLIPDGQQDEIGHGWDLGANSHNGSFQSDGKTYMWRDAWGGNEAYFSYAMKVDADNTNYLYVKYWGSDGPFSNGGVTYARSFNIYVDNEKVASQTLNSNNPSAPYEVFYEIPLSITSGKTSVRVKFEADSATSCAGGVLELRTTNKGALE
ncbi:MAG: glycoside hydrolase family 127 protein [Clostridia bacterium]|nr:glycoside hydrolase family 127 protein [Clostridia bacterium]